MSRNISRWFTFFMLLALVIFAVAYIRKNDASQQAEPVDQNEAAPGGPEAVQPAPVQEPASDPFVLVKGVSLSPKSYDQLGLVDFVGKAGKAGTIINWVGDWDDLAESDSAPNFLASMSSRYDYVPLVQVQPFNQGTGKFLRPLDGPAKERYKGAAVAFVKKNAPGYFGIGVEANVFYEKDPQGFGEFVAFYNEVYDAVKAASPGTKVFTTFELEKMKGMNGGLFGGTNDDADAEWELLGKFKSDVVGFTTYPGFVYGSPSEMPDDYYSSILSHVSKPVVFTEIGWHTAASPSGWESSGDEQAEFVTTFLSMMDDVGPEFVIWSFVYDQDTFEPFDSMGMIGRDGTARPAWAVWIAAK